MSKNDAYDRRVAAWQRALARERRKPNPAALSLAATVLAAQLDRALAAKRSIDTKATAIIPAIGLAASLLIGHVAVQGVVNTILAATGGIAALSSVYFALSVLVSRSYSNGPDAISLARITDVDTVAFKTAYVDSLAIAVESAEYLLVVAAARLNRSLATASAATASLLVLVTQGAIR